MVSIGTAAAVARELGKPFRMEDIQAAAPREHDVRVPAVGAGICDKDIVVRDAFPCDKLIGKSPFDQINEACHAAEPGKLVRPLLLMRGFRMDDR